MEVSYVARGEAVICQTFFWLTGASADLRGLVGRKGWNLTVWLYLYCRCGVTEWYGQLNV
jgi:hypothetical protein